MSVPPQHAQNSDTSSVPPRVGKKTKLGALITQYVRAGFSLILVGDDKRPLGKWANACETRQSAEVLLAQLRHQNGEAGLAVVGGEVSGGLVVIDFDPDKDGRAQAAFDLEAEFITPWREAIRSHIDPDTLPCQQTPSGGMQFYFRCDDPDGNTKLAGVPAWHKDKGKILKGTPGAVHYAIETRGARGYAVIPTPDSGRSWLRGDLDKTPHVAPDVAAALIGAAQKLDRTPRPTVSQTPKPNPTQFNGESVIDAFNEAHTPEELLERNGYVQHSNQKWLAPDSSSQIPGVSVKDGRVISWHASDPLSDGHAHDAFGIYTVLEHGGDVKAAVKQAAADLNMVNSHRKSTGTPEDTSTNPIPDLLIYHRTDYGNAERLHELCGNEFRYSPALGFIVWDGKRWKIDEENTQMKRLAVLTARELQAQTLNLDDSDTRMSWGKYALSCERSSAISNAIDLVKSIQGVGIEVSDLDADPMQLNVLNGTINLQTGQLEPHDPTHLITKIAPVKYDPEATCPKWLEFQRAVCAGDEDLVHYKQRSFGYALTGRTDEDALFVLWGHGSNGKSTETGTIAEIMGDYATTAQFETFAVKKSEGVRNDLADLVGARFVTASEGESGQRLAEGLVKQLTGGDKIKARFLHKEFFEFQPAFKAFLATNHKPVIRGTDEGIWRRIKLVPYTVTFRDADKDPQLPVKLAAEAAGIFNWLIEGCLMWQQSGLGSAKAVSAATQTYRTESDALAEFISACCRVDELYSEPAGALYAAYVEFAERNGDKPHSSTLFGTMLSERGFVAQNARKDGKTVRMRTGIALEEQS